jgi:LPXTG-motif cell wall-anchored protein
MTSRAIYNIIVIVVSVFCSAVVAAQNTTIVRATIDRSSILIGEPIRLTLQADIPESQPIRFFQFDSLPHFEFLRREKIDTVNTSYGTVLTQLIHITSFDSGHWVIPPFVLQEEIVTDSLPVDVGFSPFNPGQPYHDIKDVIDVAPEEEKKEQWWWYVVAGAVLLLLVIWLVFRKKKKPVAAIIAPPPDPYKVAIESLEKLRNHKTDPKQYYSKLTDIFRVYVSAKKGIHSMQKTTDDLVVQLRDLRMPKEQFDKLSQALRLVDFVKFAKYEPAAKDEGESFDSIRKSIDQIEQMQ